MLLRPSFFPGKSHTQNDEHTVQRIIKRWVDAGANAANMFVDLGQSIGADEVESTTCIQINYVNSLGGHIRPKNH